MSGVFASKLDRLGETVKLAASADHRALAGAISACASFPVLAVGSGGSAITAEVLAACRNGLGHQPTTVVTPMGFVLDAAGAPGTHTWLFSASGGNPDILAAFDAAVAEPTSQIDIVTSGPDGALATRARGADREACSRLHLAPVADPKDGFLATHSVVSAAVTIAMAADLIAGWPAKDVRERQLSDDVQRLLAAKHREALVTSTLAELADRDTVFLLHDPHLTAAAVLLETSFWEAGICAVQRADFRNFAHGRHVWMARHPDRTFVIAMTCDRSRESWRGIRRELPATIPSADFDFGRPGRGGLIEANLLSLAVVEAAGTLKGVDPGKPGVTEFGRRIFDRQDLRDAMRGDDASILRKRRARARMDPADRTPTDWVARRAGFSALLGGADVRAIVLDYDGTVVSTSKRRDPPKQEILSEISGLADYGVLVGFATGRGGSVGSVLRSHLPQRLHSSVVVGYYNGAHIVPLDVDIEKHPPKADEAIARLHALLSAEDGLFVDNWRPKAGRLQLTIPFENLVSKQLGISRIEEIVENSSGTAFNPGSDAGVSAVPGQAASPPWKPRLVRSGHSLDIFPGWAGKGRVVEALRTKLGQPEAHVLRVGDSGGRQGNDYELLADSLGLSVDQVCENENCCWNLLPAGVIGPDGLSRILQSLKRYDKGVLRVDVSVLFQP